MTAPTLTTKLDREAPDAKARFDHNRALAEDLREKVAEAFFSYLDDPTPEAYALLVAKKAKLRALDRRAGRKGAHHG